MKIDTIKLLTFLLRKNLQMCLFKEVLSAVSNVLKEKTMMDLFLHVRK